MMVFEYRIDLGDPEVAEGYGAASTELRTRLQSVPGGVDVERFESCATPGRYVTIATFEDEAAVGQWRRDPVHREAQRAGRDLWFDDYRLRMAEVLRDYGPRDREDVPTDAEGEW